MGTEVLTVSTSARRLWELVHRPIAHALAELDGGPHEFRLGGGTALAARWRHRDSFDIDLVVDRNAQLSELANPANPFDHTMRALGGTPEYSHRQCTVTFPSGQVDLLQVDPVPPGAEHIAVVNGTPALVLDTAQILHGKLERADKIAVRDVFDFIKAADLDPDALAAAVNCRSRRNTEIIAVTFEEADGPRARRPRAARRHRRDQRTRDSGRSSRNGHPRGRLPTRDGSNRRAAGRHRDRNQRGDRPTDRNDARRDRADDGRDRAHALPQRQRLRGPSDPPRAPAGLRPRRGRTGRLGDALTLSNACAMFAPGETLILGVCVVERCRRLAGLVGRRAEPQATLSGLGDRDGAVPIEETAPRS